MAAFIVIVSLLIVFEWNAGVLFNPLCPEWLQTALLTMLLLVVVRKTFQKGLRQWNEEQKSIEKTCAFAVAVGRFHIG